MQESARHQRACRAADEEKARFDQFLASACHILSTMPSCHLTGNIPFLPVKFYIRAKVGQRKKKIHTHTVTTLLRGPTRERVEHWATHRTGPPWPFIFLSGHLLLPKNASLSFFPLSDQSSLLSPRHCSPCCNTPMGEGEKCFFFFFLWSSMGCLLASQEVSVTLVVKVVHRVLVASWVAASS